MVAFSEVMRILGSATIRSIDDECGGQVFGCAEQRTIARLREDARRYENKAHVCHYSTNPEIKAQEPYYYDLCETYRNLADRIQEEGITV
jgi:hypothetical protein